MLELQHLSFAWGKVALFEEVSFTVQPGEIAVLAGANGAGKTTLMRVIAGLAVPTQGRILADGFDVRRHLTRFHRLLGYLSENVSVDRTLSVKGYLTYRARIRGELSNRIRHRVAEALHLCSLERDASRPIASLSFGLRKRVALADALLLRPRVLLLDDLLAGLDPVMKASLSHIFATLSPIASILISGHEIDELATWATQFYVLRQGHLLREKTASQVKSRLGLTPFVPSAGGTPT